MPDLFNLSDEVGCGVIHEKSGKMIDGTKVMI
jgi:hypothetical protein